MNQLLINTADLLKSTGVFSGVVIRDSGETSPAREPAAYIEPEGTEEINDGGAMITQHRINIFVRLISIGRANLTPLNTALEKLKDSGTHSLSSSVFATDKRTVTFRIRAEYRS